MSRTVTSADTARGFSDLLNRLHASNESFLIVREGELVGVLRPPPEAAKRATVADLLETVRRLGSPDDRFADDLAEIQAAQPAMPGDPRKS